MMNTQQNTQQKNKYKFGYFNRIKTNAEFSKLVYGFIDDYSLPLHSYNWSLLDGGDNTKNLYICYNKDKTQLYGYMVVNKKEQLIYSIDTFRKKENIALMMIEQYEKQFKVNLKPKEIAEGAEGYWKKINRFP